MASATFIEPIGFRKDIEIKFQLRVTEQKKKTSQAIVDHLDWLGNPASQKICLKR